MWLTRIVEDSRITTKSSKDMHQQECKKEKKNPKWLRREREEDSHDFLLLQIT